MTDVWIYEKLLAGICIKVLDVLTKNVFCHPISFHFYLCNHFQSPVFPHWHSSTKSLQSSLSDTHSFNSAGSIMAQELYIDTSMVYSSRVSLILCLAASQPHSWPFNKHVHRDAFMDGLLTDPPQASEPVPGRLNQSLCVKSLLPFVTGKSTKTTAVRRRMTIKRRKVVTKRHRMTIKRCKRPLIYLETLYTKNSVYMQVF